MSTMTELSEAFIEEQQPTVSEIRRWIGEARKAGAAEQREADAATVRAAGCLCREIFRTRYPAYPNDYIEGSPHDPRCPEAIAAAIQKGR